MNKAVVSILIASIVVPNFVAQTTSPKKQASGRSTTRKQQAAPIKSVTTDTPSKPVEPEKEVKPSVTKSDAAPAIEASQTAPEKTSASPNKETTSNQTGEKSAQPELPADPIADLRHKIESATVVEKLRLQVELANQLVMAGRQSEAMAELVKASSTDIFDPTSFYNIGNSFAGLGATDAAINSYRKAIEQRKGRYSRAYNNMGVILLRSGRWAEAQDAFLSALKLENFRYAEASYNLGRLYAAQGQNDLATREWRRALSVDPGHSAAAEALSRSARVEKIVVDPKSVNEPKPRLSGSVEPRKSGSLTLDTVSFDYLQRARNAAEHGNNSDAIDNYQRLIARQGGYFAPANLEMSYALITLRRYDEALTNLLQVVTKDGTRYPISYYHLARVHEIKGDLKRAEQEFTQAADAYGPENNQFLLDLSRVREKQGNYKGALEAMEKYVTRVEAKGLKYEWSAERLSALRQKVATVPK